MAKTGQKNTGFRNLTLYQIRYLTELEKLGNKRGVVTRIAENCGVSHPAVSSFFKSCVRDGYLTADLEFTENGRRMLRWHRNMVKNLSDWLDSCGLKEGKDEIIGSLIEHVDYPILEQLIRRHPDRGRADTSGSYQEDGIRDIRSVLEYGSSEVSVAFFKVGNFRRHSVSMADRGFEHTAILRNSRRASYLELSIRDMTAVSRANGEIMTGRLSGLKYISDSVLVNAEIRDGKVRIPLEACTFRSFDRGIIRGSIDITVSCSVGDLHMPESTARLVFTL